MCANFARPRALLALVLLLYVALATLFAVFTPPWQAPDEPAHYNYVGYVAAHGDFPVLQMGDYPNTYLEEIKARGFPPDLSVAPIRYEFHQPPLYYVLAAPIFSLAGGDLLALRLFSVVLGAGLVFMAYAIARRVCPDRPALALGTAAFVATLPQHLATVSQVGNDVLAELLFAMTLFVLIGELRGTAGNCGELGGTRRNSEELGGAKERSTQHATRNTRHATRNTQHATRNTQHATRNTQHAARNTQHATRSTQHAVRLGLLLGLILVTKTTAYIALPLAGGVLVWLWWRERVSLRRMATEAAQVAVPAAVIALPWFVRNILTYGWPDFFGLIRHDAIVLGQPRTAEWLAQFGWNGYLERLITFTFKSFWGVFGWLGVFMDSRVYFGLALLSAIAAAGLLQNAKRKTQNANGATDHAPRTTQYAIRNTQYALLILSTLLTCLVYAWYNVQFVQHQGRYLFTALIPVALAFAVGWDRAVRPPNGRILAAGLVVFGFGLAAWGVLTGHGLPKWPLAITVVLAGGLAVMDFGQRLMEGRSRSTQHAVRSIFFALPFAALPLLALYALFGAIVPQLIR
ncbi:MAG: glycosyltransferase family 39 protein [Chloroflexi bacterium]|nr:glycosyltransferase family 39 protein [Chloroflexota bacterium]